MSVDEPELGILSSRVEAKLVNGSAERVDGLIA